MKEKLQKSKLLSKITTCSAYTWFLATLVFIFVIFVSTKLFSIDPCYSPGCHEETWLLPMLGSFFIGSISFGLMIFTGFLRKVLRAEKWSAPFGIGAGKTTILTLLVVIISLVYILGAFRKGVSFGGGYTGQEVLDEINKHRIGIGVQSVKVNPYLCDNLVERWKMAKAGKNHEGFNEWVNKEEIRKQGFGEIAEILVTSPTPKDAVYYWTTSPGHKTALENPAYNVACSYAAEGTAVVILSTK